MPLPVMEGPRNNRRYITEVLVEKILLNLPVKSIFRFSVVSESWYSMIFAPEFSKRYRGREMIVLRSCCGSEDKALVCPISYLTSSDINPMDCATPFTVPFPANSYLHASCGQLWLLESNNSLILYNPSMHTYRKLPAPSAPIRPNPAPSAPIRPTIGGTYVYGLGFDLAADDYKVLKIHPDGFVDTEVYSVKSNSWKKISRPPYPLLTKFLSSKGLFASGLLCWLGKLRHFGKVNFIVAFDLCSEKFRLLLLPKTVEERKSERAGIAAFGGKLHLYINYKCSTRFDVWVLEEYESEFVWKKEFGSKFIWMKELEFSYVDMEPLCDYHLKPLYFCDKFGNLVKAVTFTADMGKIYVSKDGSTIVEKNFGMDKCEMFDTYVEGFDLA